MTFLIACEENSIENRHVENEPMFELVSADHSGIGFKNDVQDLKEFNYLRFQYMYNGGGVAAGDINNDGLTDLYFTSNQKSNKLYLNKGEFKFEDITAKSGVSDVAGWSTGVSFNDFNLDGLLDIYVCKSASIEDETKRRNKLFINQGNNSFLEESEKWGIDDPGFSVQSYFLDYDKDGDLDLYLVNHRIDFTDNMKTDDDVESNLHDFTSDQLYRNEGNHFINVTKESGVFNHAWGLSASVGDFNGDGWEDIYVCNDFIQGDYLYINNQDGTFTNEITNSMNHISFYSMGSDYEDLNNDLLPDLVVLDMVSEDHERNIRNMAAMDAEKFRHVREIGYHRQYMFNMLQLNRGDGTYSEIAQAAGVAKSDWSWAPLLADFDNDGYKDVFVTNGIKKDVTDIDYKDYVMRRGVEGNAMGFNEVFNRWPATKLSNYLFRNTGQLQFENVAKDWGIGKAVNSNGCAYADLDNDGDLDLITNNIDEVSYLYKNNSRSNYIRVVLKGSASNPLAIGAKVIVENNGMSQSKSHYLNRGYLSSVEPGCIFGLGDNESVEKITVIWPDGKISSVRNARGNQSLEFDHSDSTEEKMDEMRTVSMFYLSERRIEFQHVANEFDDFDTEILLPHKQSTFGARMAKGDVNGDGLEDLFLGNDKGNAPSLFIQDENGSFISADQAFWNTQARFEDMESLFFDADNDGDQDLFVVSGGNEFDILDPYLQDRLYINDGSGKFSLSTDQLPEYLMSGCSVASGDLDNDGDLDLFVGGKVVPGKYPVAPSSKFLENQDGIFVDVTNQKTTHLNKMGMVTDSEFIDIDRDGDLDLLVVGEWMPVTILKNEGGNFTEKVEIQDSNGWWYTTAAADFDNDGDLDLIAGNLGKNNKFKASSNRPFHVYANDFDDNGTLDIVLTKERNGTLLPLRGRECSSEQMPFIEEKFPTFTQFGRANLTDIYGQEKLDQAIHRSAQTFATSYFENENGTFIKKELDIHAQLSPTFSFLIDDFNEDGNLDILGIGNLYEAEPETVRYDAGRGYLLLGDGKGHFSYEPKSGININMDARDAILAKGMNDHCIIISGIGNEPIIYYR